MSVDIIKPKDVDENVLKGIMQEMEATNKSLVDIINKTKYGSVVGGFKFLQSLKSKTKAKETGKTVTLKPGEIFGLDQSILNNSAVSGYGLSREDIEQYKALASDLESEIKYTTSQYTDYENGNENKAE